MLKRFWIATAAVLGLAVLTSLSICFAQQAAAPAPSVPAVEPDAMAALDRMGAYLRTLTAYSLQSSATTDQVTDDGVKLQFGGTLTMQVQMPNRLRAEQKTDRKHRQFVYDGKTLTLFGARVGYYATVPAPGTIRELIPVAEEKYGLSLPLSDLFLWGTDEAARAAIKEVAMIGPSQIGEIMCDHVVVRQEGVDWQVWVERGKTPLPRKLVITTTSEPTQPQHIAVIQWDLAPKFDANTFRFVPPKNAYRIPLMGDDSAPTPK